MFNNLRFSIVKWLLWLSLVVANKNSLWGLALSMSINEYFDYLNGEDYQKQLKKYGKPKKKEKEKVELI